jgi:hypothetical protein
MGAKHARWFVISAKTTGWLRETELVPKTQGVVSAIKETKFALNLFRRGKVPLPFPPHVADRIHEARGLYDIVRNEGRRGALGIVQSERALAKIDQEHPEGAGEGWASHQADTAQARPERGGRVVATKGCLAALSAKARHVHEASRALGSSSGARLGHLLRATSTRRSRTTTSI